MSYFVLLSKCQASRPSPDCLPLVTNLVLLEDNHPPCFVTTATLQQQLQDFSLWVSRKTKQGSQHTTHSACQGKQLQHNPRHTCSSSFDTTFHYPALVWEPMPSLSVPELFKASLAPSFVDCAQFGETWTKCNLLKLPFLLFSLFFSCETALIDSCWAD